MNARTFEVDDITHDELEAANINKLDLVGVSAIYVSYLNNSSSLTRATLCAG